MKPSQWQHINRGHCSSWVAELLVETPSHYGTRQRNPLHPRLSVCCLQCTHPDKTTLTLPNQPAIWASDLSQLRGCAAECSVVKICSAADKEPTSYPQQSRPRFVTNFQTNGTVCFCNSTSNRGCVTSSLCEPEQLHYLSDPGCTVHTTVLVNRLTKQWSATYHDMIDIPKC